MSFLDRFKIHPKHKSADPEIRLAGVAELGTSEEDTGTLVALRVEVHTYDGSDLSLKGDGGPTCLTAPLLRSIS